MPAVSISSRQRRAQSQRAYGSSSESVGCSPSCRPQGGGASWRARGVGRASGRERGEVSVGGGWRECRCVLSRSLVAAEKRVFRARGGGLLGWGVDYARRINLFAAATSAVAAGLWFLIGERWLQPIVSAAGRRRLVAGAGVVVGATMFTVWNQSVGNEKVYTLSVVTIVLVLWLAVRWGDQPVSTRREHHLVLI